MSTFRDHLNEKHFVPVPHGIPHEELLTGIQAFLTFLEEVPEETKRRIHFTSSFERGSAEGYNDKRDIIGKDSKEFFHWSPRLLEYPAYSELYTSSAQARTFFDSAEAIYTKIDTLATNLFLTEFPELAHHCVVDGKLAYAVLRFLCYAPNKAGAFSAQPHYDKGYGTLAITESTPGLRIGCCDKHPLTKIVHENGTALFMPADLMFGDSGRTIIPTWHDVVTEVDTKPVSERCERWAMVFFICDKEGRFSSWDKVHSPLMVHENN